MPTAQSEGLRPPSEPRHDADELAVQWLSSDVASPPSDFRGSQGVEEIGGAVLSIFDAKCWLLCVTEFFYDSYCPHLQRSTMSSVFWRYWRNASTPWKVMRSYHTKTMSMGQAEISDGVLLVFLDHHLLESEHKDDARRSRAWEHVQEGPRHHRQRHCRRCLASRSRAPKQGFPSCRIWVLNTWERECEHDLQAWDNVNRGGANDGRAQFDQASLRPLSNNFGPVKVSYRANFADIYALSTVMLYNGGLHRCLGRSCLNLFEHGPRHHCRPHHDISQSLS